MASTFASWLSSFSPVVPRLAWCHTTDAYRLRELINCGGLAPQQCPVFGENLTYFFYGRPAYRIGTHASIGPSARAPVTLLLEPDLVVHAKRIFPFDTGAFHAQRYANWLHPHMKKEDFEITAVGDGPEKHVNAFFGSNASYFTCTPINPSAAPAEELEAEALGRMVMDSSAANADDRRIAVEMHTGKPIVFDKTLLRAIIGPHSLQTASWLRTFLSGPGKGVEYVPYSFNHLKSATEYQGLFEEKARELQSKWGMI
jgi:hypothetical protein